MRMRIAGIGMCLLLSAAAMTARQSGPDLYQQGLARETAGDIKGAIEIFERLVRESSSNRTLTARALVQLGRWSDLIAQDQGRKYYERVVREFADQKDAAADARARLDALAKVAAPSASPARRLAIDWADWRPGTYYGTPTRDGRHWLRYNLEPRAFELVEIGTGTVRGLTAEGPGKGEGVGAIHLSTDGRRLAASITKLGNGPLEFTSFELRVFDVGGRGAGRVLATWDAQALARNWIAIQPFAWAPRDDRIWLFVMRRDQSAQIASVDLSGKLEVLKTLTWRDLTQAPSLSRDGRFVTYHDAPRGEPADLHILATDGSGEHRVEHPAEDSKPTFLPDGSGVVFESNRRGVRDLWYLAVADGKPVGQPRLVWRNAAPFGTTYPFADNGSLFYYFSTNDWATYTVPLDVNSVAGPVGPATRVPAVANETNTGAAFSPDGRYLAHFRANAARIVIREITTGHEREIPFGTQLTSGYAGADWCANGDTVIVTGYAEGGQVAYRVNVKDASAQRLPVAARYALCVGSGEEIIYADRLAIRATAQTGLIARRSLVSGRETTLYKGMVRSLARSPDGKRLAFIVWDLNAGVNRLFTMPAEGGDVSADLTPQDVDRNYLVQEVAWMPEGDRLLVVVVETGGSFDPRQPPTQQPTWLWEVPLTGAAPRKLGLLPLPKVKGTFLGANSFAVRADGKQLAFQSHEGFVEQTWAIDNLFQFIKAGGGW